MNSTIHAAPAGLSAAADRHLPATIAFLRDLVGINSYTRHAAGVNANANRIADQFEPLGFQSLTIPPANPEFGHHLILDGPVIPGAPTIALISHLDTVYPAEEEVRNAFHWRPDGSRIIGPGTCDIKGGTALIYLLLATLAEAWPALFSGVNWCVLLNSCEEVDSSDFGRISRAHLPADTRAALLFEADGGSPQEFALVSSRKGRATFRVETAGRGAHAGGSHRRGVSAITQIARTVNDLETLTDHAATVTVNVGSIHGGTVTNRVPHHATADLEMRAFDPDFYARTKSRILAMTGDGTVRSVEDSTPCQVTVELLEETPPWPRNAGTDHLLTVWSEAAATLGVPLIAHDRGGLSDGNVLWDYYPTLDALGPCGGSCHCSEYDPAIGKEPEWVDRDSFVPKTMLNALAISRLVADVTPR